MLPPLPRPSLFFPIICSAAASFLFYSIFVTPLRPSRALLRPPSRFSTSWTASLFLFWPSSFPSLALLLPLSSRLPLSPLPLRASHESLPGQRGYGATARRPFNRATRAFSIHSAAISWLEYEWNNPLQCRTWFKDFPQMPRNCLENFWKQKVSRGFVTDLTHHVQKLYFLLDTKCRSLRYVELIDIFGVVSVEWFFFSSLDHLSGRKSSRTAKGWILKYLRRIMLVGWDLGCIVWQEDVKEEPDLRQGDDSLLCEFSR